MQTPSEKMSEKYSLRKENEDIFFLNSFYWQISECVKNKKDEKVEKKCNALPLVKVRRERWRNRILPWPSAFVKLKGHEGL